MRTDEGIHRKWKPNTDHRPTTMASNTVLRCLKSRAKGCPRVYNTRHVLKTRKSQERTKDMYDYCVHLEANQRRADFID